MFQRQPYFIFYMESLINENNELDSNALNFIKKLSKNNCYFLTHNCNISRQTFYNNLVSNNIPCIFNNVVTPNYIISYYYKNNYKNLSICPISSTEDFNDFNNLNIKIDYKDPSLIFIQTLNLNEKSLNILYKNNSPIVISSNLCINRSLACNSCKNICLIKNLKQKFKPRIIIPDIPPTYNIINLFKFMNISPKKTVVITNVLRDDYYQYQQMGCNTILILNKGTTYNDYLQSPYDPDLVLDNFLNLSTFLNKSDKF